MGPHPVDERMHGENGDDTRRAVHGAEGDDMRRAIKVHIFTLKSPEGGLAQQKLLLGACPCSCSSPGR